MYAFADTLLRVDLTRRTCTKEQIPFATLKKCLGGTGLGVKLMIDEVPPEIAFDDPRNKFIISTGPLGGTKIRGSGNIGVVTKGALTGGLATSQANGFMGAFLKFCGYASVVFEGAADSWVYLYIDDDTVEIKPAGHLLGLDTTATQDALHKEYGTNHKNMSVYCIGPAGENLVKFACFTGDYGHVAAHNGVGAVLGSKKVKAIAVKRGSRRPEIAHPEEFNAIVKDIHATSIQTPSGKTGYAAGTNTGHIPLYKTGQYPIKNNTVYEFPEVEKYFAPNLRSETVEFQKSPCWACDWTHCGFVTIKEGRFAGTRMEEPEYEAMAAMGPIIGVTDPAESLVLADIIDRLGFDCNETGWLMGWVCECAERGYLTKEMLNGHELGWNKPDGVRALLYDIARRNGVGDFLAEGTRNCAKKIGPPAQDCAVYANKGNSPRGHDHRGNWAEHLDTCTSSSGTVETMGGGINITQHGAEPLTDRFDWQQIAFHNSLLSGRRVYEDSLGVCRLSAVEDIHETARALSLATGEHYDFEQVMKIGKRTVALMRLFNSLAGMFGEEDYPSKRYGEAVGGGPLKGIDIGAVYTQMRERLFELNGWDKISGVPLAETMSKLGAEEYLPLVEKANALHEQMYLPTANAVERGCGK